MVRQIAIQQRTIAIRLKTFVCQTIKIDANINQLLWEDDPDSDGSRCVSRLHIWRSSEASEIYKRI
jgi:hypothetical protein